MTLQEVLKGMLGHRGYSQKRLAREIGTQACTITAIMKSGNTTTRSLVKSCNVLGYEIVLRPKNYVRPMDMEMILDES